MPDDRREQIEARHQESTHTQRCFCGGSWPCEARYLLSALTSSEEQRDAAREALAVRKVWIVTGYDVGGNSGEVTMGVFDNEAKARWYAENSPDRKHNNTFGSSVGAPFAVEGHEIMALEASEALKEGDDG